MAGLLVNCIDVARTIVSVYTSRVREPRGASHTQLRHSTTNAQQQLSHSTTNARIMQHAMAQGLRNPCPWPAQLGQLGSADASARCPAASTILSTSTVAVPVVDHRCGQRAHQPRRQARQGAARGCRDESWPLIPPRAASGSGEALGRLRGSSETSRQLCGRFFCTPEGRSQRGLRRSPTPKLDAASMGHGAPWQGTQWQRLGSMLLCGCSVTGHLSSGRDLQTGSRAKNGSLQLQEACMTPFRTKGQPDNLISAFRCS